MNNDELFSGMNIGNGDVKGLSSARRSVVKFAPISAPISEKRGLKARDEKPGVSLRVGGVMKVFGVKDVAAHGQREYVARLNARERYTSDTYFEMFEAMTIQLFPGQRGTPYPVAPQIALSVPVDVYNDADAMETIRKRLKGKHNLVDWYGCELRLEVWDRKLKILPEGAGAMYHYAFNADGEKRAGTNIGGTTLLIDIGYETTQALVFEGMKFQRDLARTFWRRGMGVVVRDIHEYAMSAVRGADVSRIDAAIRPLAGMKPGAKKEIEVAQGVRIDITEVYDAGIKRLADGAVQDILTAFPYSFTRVVLNGGTALHLDAHLREWFAGMKVATCPDADDSEVRGLLTMLTAGGR